MTTLLAQVESSNLSPRFYIIDCPNHPWGDYGNILAQGMAHRGEGGVLEIERTGPFVPPITLPGIGEVVVTEELRQSLGLSGLKGLAFETLYEEMGNLWALELNRNAQTHREKPIVEHRHEIKLVTSTWNGQDIFGAQGVGFIYITESAKSWFERHVPGRLAFEEAATTAV